MPLVTDASPADSTRSMPANSSVARTELIECRVDFGMEAAKVCPIHITLLKEIDQVAHKFGAEIVLRNVALNQGPYLAE
jgi:hypothetical protein